MRSGGEGWGVKGEGRGESEEGCGVRGDRCENPARSVMISKLQLHHFDERLKSRVEIHTRPFEGYRMPVRGVVSPFLSNFGQNCPRFLGNLSKKWLLTGVRGPCVVNRGTSPIRKRPPP